MAKSNPLPSQEVLNKLLRYNEKTGKLYFQPRPLEFFTAEGHSPAHSCAKWNSRWAEKEALTKINVGYRCGRLLYQYVLAHRVIYKMMTGEEAVQVDHIDGNRLNNRWDNLRNVTSHENRKNAAIRKDSITGVTGVSWIAKEKRWQAHITVDSKNIHLGSFKYFDAAVEARKAAEKVYNFHPNHGREPIKP